MKAGDFVVHPSHGVCRISRVERKFVGGKGADFLVLNSVASHATVLILRENIEIHAHTSVGVRPLSSTSQIDAALELIRVKKDAAVDQTTWNRRYREWIELIKSGQLVSLATVIRNLAVLRASKDLSFGERKMLDEAVQRLRCEAAVVYGISHDHAEEMIHHAMEAK